MAQESHEKTSKHSSFKSFRNNPSAFMEEALGGLVAAHPNASWHDEGFIGITEDKRSDGRVAVISGGGSGHEPMHAGFIGAGMLDAACPGLLFTSPNAVQITAATEWADQGKGVVHVVKNYTGDVMNFSVAANSVDGEVATVTVADDAATEIDEDDDSPGRRGTGATIIVEKIAGASAARGDEVATVAELAQKAADQSRSMAVALMPGHLPTSDRQTFDLEEGEIEIGVGIHGEPGVERRDTTAGEEPSAKALVGELLDGVAESLANAGVKIDGADVALLVNGLGGTSELELDLIFGEALSQLADRGANVRRGLVGTLVTSLNMAGVSLTVTVVDDELLELLDAETDAPAWPAVVEDPTYSPARMVDDREAPNEGGENVWLSAFANRLAASYDDLTELDRVAGDGDFGQNLEAAFGDIQTPLKGTDAEVLEFFAHRMLVRAGGTSGAVLGTLFREMADAFTDARVDSRGADTADFTEALAAGLNNGVQAITDLGGAKEGDNTLIDALAPAAKEAKQLADGSAPASIDEVLEKIHTPAVEGAKSTRGMQAKKGRASYLGESAADVPDPGAISITWLFGEASVDEF
ncbi:MULTISPECIES: dihydroxyacetone kinase family protein [unclassified Corynebacterium]|uniref:dihydroxyacetone kinase family protein n=1 Tax=unclassified Corynebacterium TaxID=2624378 RepID=UPI00264D2FAB|nr:MULTISPECIES: dihydroxyacetone kinase family protein [unclassified Corynebacterium]MDN8593571.1 dihydroxyacetone kinase family protein [Corynebacterium sp. P4_F2]WKK55699.1 dihydroxyacetone kinase family protein [Corynebacterium sp. P4-C1]WKK63107.1 dihydroxyacetone kinase family protein [Corynebacterium sp. P8-C1]